MVGGLDMSVALVSFVSDLALRERETEQCIKQVGELVRGKVVVGHALQNDLQVNGSPDARSVQTKLHDTNCLGH